MPNSPKMDSWCNYYTAGAQEILIHPSYSPTLPLIHLSSTHPLIQPSILPIIHPSAYPPTHLTIIHSPTYPFLTHPFTHSSTYPSIHSHIHYTLTYQPLTQSSIYLSTYLPIHPPPIHLSIHQSIHLSIYASFMKSVFIEHLLSPRTHVSLWHRSRVSGDTVSAPPITDSLLWQMHLCHNLYVTLCSPMLFPLVSALLYLSTP